MGEYAREAMYDGINEMGRNFERYGTICPGNPRYDNNYWEDVTGKVRRISDMDSMHLALVLIWMGYMKDNAKGYNHKKFYSIRSSVIRKELVRRRFTSEDYKSNIVGVKLGLYCMYPNEDGSVEEYYKRMLDDKSGKPLCEQGIPKYYENICI